MNKNDVSIFSFDQETSFINFKKVFLMTPDIQALSNQQKTNKLTPTFYYDKFTNQFIYINGEVIIILDTKLKMVTFSRIIIEEKINSVSVEYNNKYMLLTTFENKVHLFNLLDLEEVDFEKNKKVQYIGGFFIPYKRPEKQHDYFIICFMTKNNFHIKRLLKVKDDYNNSFKYSIKTNYISNKMKIIDYDFNHVFKILLIIKSNPISFVIFNLKSKNCYSVPIIVNVGNIRENEYKIYLQQIYEKLYLVYLDNTYYIKIYRLNDLKKMKNPRRIKYNYKQEYLEIKNIKVQFYNNLIFLYFSNFIKIYDIKSKVTDFEIFSMDIKESDYNIFIKASIFGKYLLINNDYYKIKFSKTKYKKESNCLSKDIFFVLLRRKKSNSITNQILFEYLNNYKINNFFEVLEEIIINHKTFIDKLYVNNNVDKINAYQVLYIGNNHFFLTEDYLLTLFNQHFDNSISPEMLIKALCYMFHLYNKYDFDLNDNLFYASLFGQLNKTDDLVLLEYLVKNEIIPVNEKIGIYLLMKASNFNDKVRYKKCFGLGIDILVNAFQYTENNIDDVLEHINSNNQIETFDIFFKIFYKIKFK